MKRLNDQMDGCKQNDSTIDVGHPAREHLENKAKERFRSWALGDEEFAKVLVLCAEVGMGKTWLSKSLLSHLEEKGIYTKYESLKNVPAENAVRVISRISREMRAATLTPRDQKAVIIDDIPPVDECDLTKISRAIQRMVKCNTLVVICMLPEVAMLQEELSDAPVLFSSDLAELVSQPYPMMLYDHKSMSEEYSAASVMTEWTNGQDSAFTRYPSLVRPLEGRCSDIIRSSLPHEEQQLRLTMILLGEGTFEDLALIVEKLDYETLALMRRDAPMFSIDRAQEAFVCPEFVEDATLDRCLDELKGICSRYPDTTMQIARNLATQGRYGRAAIVCAMCADADLALIGTTWGVEMICTGNLPVVNKALGLFQALGLSPTYSQALSRLAIQYLCEPATKLDDLPLPDSSLCSSQHERRQEGLVTLIRSCRDLDRNQYSGHVPIDTRDVDELSSVLADHLRARYLLMSGEITEAYALLVNNPARLRPDTLVAALLCDDFEIAQMLIGEAPREDERESNARARHVLARSGVERLCHYQELLEPMLMVLVGRAETFDGSEAGIAYAERMGDSAVKAILLEVSAVLDNRRAAYTRAHVRALQAIETLGGVRGRYLMLVTRLVGAMSSYALGDALPLDSLVRHGPPSRIRDLASFMLCKREDEGANVELTTLMRSACSRDVTWMLNMLCNDFGEGSRLYSRTIPASWAAHSRRSVRLAEAFGRATNREREPLSAKRDSATSDERRRLKEEEPVHELDKPVRISLLGGFSITVKGNYVSTERLRKRRGFAFLAQLAAHKRHALARYELIEAVWPEHNYSAGMQRIYEATSQVRVVLRGAGCEEDPLEVVRGEGFIALNEAVVHCDVDDFEQAVYATLSADTDEHVMDCAVKAMTLYKGDLCDMPYDALNLIEARRDELKNLYVDICVSGALAALRLGQFPLALHMASAAHDANELREDAASVLVEALRSSGRSLDARETYRAFASKLLEVTGEPPSASLRAAVRSLFPKPKGGSGN